MWRLKCEKKICSNYLREVKPSLVAAISFRAPKACSAHISHLSPSGLEIRRRASRLCWIFEAHKESHEIDYQCLWGRP